MATRLKKLKINEVSLVTKPAIAREFLLYKSEDGMPEEAVKDAEPIVGTEKPAIDCQKAVICPECGNETEQPFDKETGMCKACAKKVAEGMCKFVCPECGEEHEGEEGEMCKACKKKAAECDKVHGGTCKVVCPECGLEHEGKKGEMCKVCAGKKLKKEAEDISKALEAERLEKAAIMKELEELRKQAHLEKEAKITKEFIEKAATELKSIPTMVPATFGPVLKSASYKLEKSEFDAIYSALQAASVFIAKNAVLTKELGVGGEDLSADPAQQLDAIAKSYVSRDAKLTYAKAYEQACMNNPQLYSEHVRQARNR